ncbi:MAG TPA: DUF6232 family protein [Terriglobales bacterium]|jgi:hypothetical protein|nr:DUF6232 family protein [Terriglobales bacterium]
MSTPTVTKEETSFYTDEQGVRVTSARLIVESTTYAMGNITSVRRTIEEPSRAGPIFVGAFGVLFLAVGFEQGAGLAIFSAFLLGIAVLWWKGQKTYYGLRIASSSGESTPISSIHKERIDKIVQAVNEAVIDRG